MATEHWILSPETRSTLEQLHKRPGTQSVVSVGYRRKNPGVDLAGKEPHSWSAEKRPAYSAVAAGWIFCVLGLAYAWIFPLAHGFLLVAFLLSFFAIATRLARQGAILMTVTLISSALCVSISSFRKAAVPAVSLEMTRADVCNVLQPYNPMDVTTNSNRVQAPAASYNASGLVATNPVTLDDLALMLRAGFNDAEVVAAVQQKQLIEPNDAARMNYLRTLGAGDKLIAFLRSRPVFLAPISKAVVPAGTVTVRDPSQNVSACSSGSVTVEGTVGSSPAIDYQAKDRRIKELKDRMDALDEDIRRIRTNPKNSGCWWHYYGSYNGLDQQKLDAYLKQLDDQRNELRREKWRLEGR